MRAVRAAAGRDVAVTAKINMADGVRGGFWLDESVEFARMLEADGSLDALTLTGGSSFENPMYLFRGEAPVAEMAEMFPGVLKTGIKLFGGKFFKEYPFEEAYFLPYARQFRDALVDAARAARRHQPARHDHAARSTTASRSCRSAARSCANPSCSLEMQKDPTARVALHPLQQVHAHDLHGHRRLRDLALLSTGSQRSPESRYGAISEVLLEVPVQVDDAALLGRRHQ